MEFVQPSFKNRKPKQADRLINRKIENFAEFERGMQSVNNRR
jgi:hypothetical protein